MVTKRQFEETFDGSLMFNKLHNLDEQIKSLKVELEYLCQERHDLRREFERLCRDWTDMGVIDGD